MLLTFFNNTQQQHNDMPQNVDIVGQQYIAINIVNVCSVLPVIVSSGKSFATFITGDAFFRLFV